MGKRTRNRPGFALVDVAIAIGVLAVLLAAVTAALGAIENGRVNAAERSVETLKAAAINWLSNGRSSYGGLSVAELRAEDLLPPGFSETGSNPWGGNYTIAPSGTGSREFTISVWNIPDAAGNVLVRKFTPRARSASFADGTFAVTF